jgi:hypothetical protein
VSSGVDFSKNNFVGRQAENSEVESKITLKQSTRHADPHYDDRAYHICYLQCHETLTLDNAAEERGVNLQKEKTSSAMAKSGPPTVLIHRVQVMLAFRDRLWPQVSRSGA